MKGRVGLQGVVVKRLYAWLRLTNLDGERYDDTRATTKHLHCKIGLCLGWYGHLMALYKTKSAIPVTYIYN